MKKHLKLLLCLLTLACLLCVSVQAEEAEQPMVEETCSGIMQAGELLVWQESADVQSVQPDAQSVRADWEAAKQAVKDGLRKLEPEIGLYDCTIPMDRRQELYKEAINESPELFYVSAQYAATEKDGCIDTIYPRYLADGQSTATLSEADILAISRQQDDLEEKIAEILAPVDEKWTDLEKALYLHDYLATYAQYDLTYSIYDAYTILRTGRGVCQAYALAYELLMERAGVPCGTVSSRNLDHMWNIIRIDGDWYHVDVTWDDPVQDRPGRVRHEHFCNSDAKREELVKEYMANYSGWFFVQDWVYSLNVTANNTRFDSSYWADVDAAYVPINGTWYYLSYQDIGLMQTSDPKQRGTRKKMISTEWPDWDRPGWRWRGLFSGLSCYNSRLVYNTTKTVYSYDLVTGREQVLYTLTSEEQQVGDIYGSVVIGNQLNYTLLRTPNVETPVPVYSIQLDPYTTVAAGGYACYVKNGTLYLKRSGAQKGSVLAAWYDVNGKMLGMRLLNQQELTIPVPGAKTVKVFAVAETSYTPLCEATVLLAS